MRIGDWSSDVCSSDLLLGRSRDSRPPLRLAALRAVLRALFRARGTSCAAHRGRGAAARLGAAPLAPSRDRGAVGRVSYSALLVLARAWPLRFRAVEPRRLLGDAAEPARERDGILGGAARRIGADRHRAPARHDGAEAR